MSSLLPVHRTLPLITVRSNLQLYQNCIFKLFWRPDWGCLYCKVKVYLQIAMNWFDLWFDTVWVEYVYFSFRPKGAQFYDWVGLSELWTMNYEPKIMVILSWLWKRALPNVKLVFSLSIMSLSRLMPYLFAHFLPSDRKQLKLIQTQAKIELEPNPEI